MPALESISSPRRYFILPFFVFCSSLGIQAAVGFASPHHEPVMPFKSTLTTSPEPLTNDEIWKLEPLERNPHRKRWLVERTAQLENLKVIERKKHFIITADGVSSNNRIHLRGMGPWFTLLGDFASRFRCSATPGDAFATAEGSEFAARTASELWDSDLNARLPKLIGALRRIDEDSEEAALEAAQTAFRGWLLEAEKNWIIHAPAQARNLELKKYLDDSIAQGFCHRAGQPVQNLGANHREFSARDWIERPKANADATVLARAPAKIWGGLYTIRLSIVFGEKTLNGQFILDSGSAVSMISPRWLDSQGIVSSLVERKDLPGQKVVWSGGTGIAHRALAFQTMIADYPLPFNDFLMMDTEIFSPPSYGSSCCDGVLGTDFLRQYAIQFQEGPPPSVVFYPRKDFSLGRETPWIEVSTDPSGAVVSEDCELWAGTQKLLSHGLWDTGSEMSVEAHVPFLAMIKKSFGPFALDCDGIEIARDIPVSIPDGVTVSSASLLRERDPSFSIGMALLGRGHFTLDLANGRIWIDSQAMQRPFLTHRSGLELAYDFDKNNDRYLKVVSLKKGSPAFDQLAKSGLKVGSRIEKFGDDDVEDLDIYKVEQRLSGAAGSKISLVWRTGKTELKTAPLVLTWLPQPGPSSSPTQFK